MFILWFSINIIFLLCKLTYTSSIILLLYENLFPCMKQAFPFNDNIIIINSMTCDDSMRLKKKIIFFLFVCLFIYLSVCFNLFFVFSLFLSFRCFDQIVSVSQYMLQVHLMVSMLIMFIYHK